MLIAYLAKTRGKVVMPSAVEVVDGENRDEVSFVYHPGNVLVTFQWSDLSMIRRDGSFVELDQVGGESRPF